MNLRIVIGFALAFCIGAICRIAGVPVPAPPAIIGASLVVAMTVGFLLADKRLSHRPHTQTSNCAGPTGDTSNAA
ncbi:MAG: DUF1427 family protein [Pseudomonadota bacterium]